MGFSENFTSGVATGESIGLALDKRKKRKEKEEALGMSVEEWEVEGEKKDRQLKELQIKAEEAAQARLEANQMWHMGGQTPEDAARVYNKTLGKTLGFNVVPKVDPESGVISLYRGAFGPDGAPIIEEGAAPLAQFKDVDQLRQRVNNGLTDGKLWMDAKLAEIQSEAAVKTHKGKNEADIEKSKREAELGLIVPEAEELSRTEKLEKYKQQQANWRTARSAQATETSVALRSQADQAGAKNIKNLVKDIQSFVAEESMDDVILSDKQATKLAEVTQDLDKRKAAMETMQLLSMPEPRDPAKKAAYNKMRRSATKALDELGLGAWNDNLELLDKVLRRVK